MRVTVGEVIQIALFITVVSTVGLLVGSLFYEVYESLADIRENVRPNGFLLFGIYALGQMATYCVVFGLAAIRINRRDQVDEAS